jgi:hypothetical protein
MPVYPGCLAPRRGVTRCETVALDKPGATSGPYPGTAFADSWLSPLGTVSNRHPPMSPWALYLLSYRGKRQRSALSGDPSSRFNGVPDCVRRSVPTARDLGTGLPLRHP